MTDKSKLKQLEALNDSIFRAAVYTLAQEHLSEAGFYKSSFDRDAPPLKHLSLALGVVAYDKHLDAVELERNEAILAVARRMMQGVRRIAGNSKETKLRFDNLAEQAREAGVDESYIALLGLTLDSMTQMIVDEMTETLYVAIEQVNRNRAVDNRARIVDEINGMIETGGSDDSTD